MRERLVHYHVRLLIDGLGGRTTQPTYRRVEARVNDLWDRYSSEELSANASTLPATGSGRSSKLREVQFQQECRVYVRLTVRDSGYI